MKKINIVFSSTRQWNPGDEFILYGIKNVLDRLDVEYNSILFNRSPEIRKTFSHLNVFFKLNVNNFLKYVADRTIGSFMRIGFSDNSLKEFLDTSYVDLVIFAGSPEWWGRRLIPLYSLIEKYDIPVIFLGVGTHGKKLNISNIEKKVLKKSKLIVVRDEKTLEELNEYNPNHLPCPALLSVEDKNEKVVENVKKVGIIYSDFRSTIYNHISKESFQKMQKLYRELETIFLDRNIEVEYICHYIDELSYISKFTKLPYHYSYESRDYISIYRRFDLVIGPRVHGIGMAASLGIPGIYISHDARSQTVKGFKATQISLSADLDEVMNCIFKVVNNISLISKELLLHKRKTCSEYQKFLSKVIVGL